MASPHPVDRSAKGGSTPLERYVRQLLREAPWAREATEGRGRFTAEDQPSVADALQRQTPVAGD
jgi:hypothetical protein